MPNVWVRGPFSHLSITSVGSVVNNELYHNIIDAVSEPLHRQKVTVVATYLMMVVDTEDIFTVRLAVVNEDHPAITLSNVSLADPAWKGIYPVAKGPVYVSPRRKIDIPWGSKLFLTTVKEVGTVSSSLHVFINILLNIKR